MKLPNFNEIFCLRLSLAVSSMPQSSPRAATIDLILEVRAHDRKKAQALLLLDNPMSNLC